MKQLAFGHMSAGFSNIGYMAPMQTPGNQQQQQGGLFNNNSMLGGPGQPFPQAGAAQFGGV